MKYLITYESNGYKMYQKALDIIDTQNDQIYVIWSTKDAQVFDKKSIKILKLK